MSAIVCGKRAFFDDLPDYSSSSASPIPVPKRFRRASSTSPVRFSLSPPPPPPRNGVFYQLRQLFPSMDDQLLDKALDECGGDIDSAIKRLHELCLGYSKDSASNSQVQAQVELGGSAAVEETVPTAEPSVQKVISADGNQWVELFVKEMMSATSVDDARGRAARVLEALEKSIMANHGAATTDEYQKENMMLKEQIQGLIRENSIFKRAVQIQHLRQKEFDEKNQEVEQLKQLLSQYQEQIRGLEVNNYALSMHLKQAQQSNSIPGHFHPDIF